jgi:MFS family permease
MAELSTVNKRFINYLVGFAAFFGPFSQSIYTPMLPQVQAELRASEYLINLTISIFTAVMAVMQIVYGPLTDNKGRRKVLLPGIVLYLVATGIAVGSVVAVTVIGDLFEGKWRGRAMGTFQTMVALGPVAGPVIGGFVGQYFGFHSVFWVLAAGASILLLLCIAFLPETRPTMHQVRKFRLNDFSLVLSQQVGLSVILLGFFQYFSMYIFLVFLPLLLHNQYGLSPAQNGLVFLPLSVCMVLGSLAGGRLQEYFRPRSFLITSASVNVAAIFLFALLAATSLPVLIACIALFGLCLGLSLPVQTTLLTNEFHHNRATATGIYNFARYMGMAAGPMLGTVFSHMGHRLEFYFAGVAFALAVVCAGWLLSRSAEHKPKAY